MLRDLTMIGAVLLSVVSVGFGIYQNIQSRNNHAFIYEQSYKIIDQIQQANIPSGSKEQLTDAALGVFGTPAPVIDLSRSSADTGTVVPLCSAQQKKSCGVLAVDLASANAACTRSHGTADECIRASQIKADVVEQRCYVCYTQ